MMSWVHWMMLTHLICHPFISSHIMTRSTHRRIITGWCTAKIMFLLILVQAFIVVVPQGKTSTGAWWGNLKFIDYFFPQLIVGNSIRSTAGYHSLIKFAQVKLLPTKRGNLKILNSQLSLERNEVLLEFLALSLFVFVIHKFKFFWYWELLSTRRNHAWVMMRLHLFKQLSN